MRIQSALSLLTLSCYWSSLVHAIDGSFSAEAVETGPDWRAARLDFIAAQATPEYEPDRPTTKADKSETNHEYIEHLLTNNSLSSKQKQQAVKDAFVFAWEGYKKYSWGADENKPVSGGIRNSRNGWGATIVDALDTLYIMDLHEDFAKATDFVAAIDWSSSDVTMEVQVFETVIRYVGGLLSAYDLSGNPVFVERARDLVERLLPAFDTPTGIPYHSINLDTGKPKMNRYIKEKYLDRQPVVISNYVSILSEAGTVQLELNRLSDITGDPKYHLAGKKVIDFLEKVEPPRNAKGILPVFLDPETGRFMGDYITWGGLGDSYYEYLAKQYVYSGGRDEQAKRMFIDVIRSTEKYMVSSPKNHTQHKLLGNLRGNLELEPVMDELACFAPGTFLLAARNIDELHDIEPLAADILDSCVLAWISTRSGIAPEVFGWIDDKTGRHREPMDPRKEELASEFGVFPIVPGYILRPETIESIFYFYRFTKNEIYRDMGWELFKALIQHCRAFSGFSGITNVDAISPKWDNREESFFFAETLKYFYLLFDDTNLLPLDEWVLNTEAHPLRIQKKVK